MAEEKKVAEKKSVEKKEAETKKEVKKTEVPEKFKKLVSEIEKMSVLDLSELVKVLEEKFGVSAAAPVAVAPAGAGSESADGGAEEKSELDVELTAFGDSKINVIKMVREILGIGLKDAKDLVDAAPKVIKEKVAKAEAEEMKKKLEGVGATVTLK
ncbi:MAG TPA: 50S ribosomal protein L7/L12 [Candidatus Moranbacteria bacterium]|nr:50S ribosomal protein L7/L12 [Candidatus Moranbacteria bacterium]